MFWQGGPRAEKFRFVQILGKDRVEQTGNHTQG